MAGYRYCLAHHAEQMRCWRAANRHRPLTAQQRLKRNARSYANVYQGRGLIVRQPCQRCGAGKAQKHHHDYTQPLAITWLCRRCHRLEHQQLLTAAL